MALQPGAAAPQVPGTDLSSGPKAVFFYKVTCPTCQMAAPVAERLFGTFPDHFVAVAQDPAEKVAAFAEEQGTTFGSVTDAPPYELSDAYGIEVVPTLFLLQGGVVTDVAESWDREGWNRLGTGLAAALGQSVAPLSEDGDGLPAFRPG
ncbi:MAG TPA: redoxin domain-containing protein [Actinomycetota bacterium]|jgi:thiol-disulfide isomerase/thioredoxin|nr:redoxin domain-containing protein [Actinomycetota bacterium]